MHRSLLSRTGIFASNIVALAIFVFVALWIAGVRLPFVWIGLVLTGHLGYSISNAHQAVLSAVLERLPVTGMLIAVSVVIAGIVAWGIAVLARRASGRVGCALANIALPLRCFPYFWLVFSLEIWIAIATKQTTVGGTASSDRFDLLDRFVHILEPASLLALILIPAFATCLSARPTIGSLARTFVAKLPEVIGAAVLTETAFAWPGISRDLQFWRDDLPLALGASLCLAVCVVVARALVPADA